LAQGRLSLLLALEVAPRRGRPQIETKAAALIRRMSVENPLWGAALFRLAMAEITDMMQISAPKSRRGSSRQSHSSTTENYSTIGCSRPHHWSDTLS